MTQVDRVILDPANPHDFELSELQDLAAQLQPKLPDAEITPVLRSEEGYGGPWSEVLYIWLEVKDNVDAIGFLAVAIAWSKKRWHRDRDKHPPPEKPRPRTITVIQEETITRTVTIDLPDGEPVDEEPTPGEPLPHPEPSPEQDDLRP
jgi:hypothetical protein